MKAYNNRQTKKIGEDRYRFLNSCFILPQGSVTVNRGYSEGLGQTEYFRGDSDSQEYNKLVYFKKGAETYGNPVGTQCSPILDVAEQPATSTQLVRIMPNPFKDKTQIVVEGVTPSPDTQFMLYNVVGKEVLRQQLTSSTMTLQRNDLSSGMYIWIIKGKNTNLTGKLMIN
jgi:hypothetical protein